MRLWTVALTGCGRVLSMSLSFLVLVGCKSEPSAPTPTMTGPIELNSTSDAALSLTLQYAAAETAVWISQITPDPTSTVGPPLTLVAPGVTGASMSTRIGECVQPENTMLHIRQGFCLAAPLTWTAYNVDGGMAAMLDTTPGQALAIQPDWAESADICILMIYITASRSALDELEAKISTFRQRTDLTQLTSEIQMQALGNLAVPGFTWASSSGQSGSIFADTIGMNRVAHISFSGSQCPLDQLLPVLDTLRFNIEQ